MVLLPMMSGYINKSITCYIWYDAIVKACLLVQMIFLPMMAIYINTSLTCDIRSGTIYNLQFTLIKRRNNIAGIIWNNMFNSCIESRKYCIHIFTCIGHNNLKVFTTVRYINIHLYNITRAYQSCTLTYLMRVSFMSKCAYDNIQAYPPRVYHVVRSPIT